MMKMDRSTVSRYETGKSIPTYQTVIRFAEVYQVEKEYLVEELDHLLPKAEDTGYILKEDLEDQELKIILKLLRQEPDLKNALFELHLMQPNRKAYYIDLITASIKVNKRHKNKMETQRGR
ncbi:transcriptional regulator with XRE-family HTH domain [Neobacillus ginsengisoli]|uniref:Transcriptional regulator with XRE-family HTH domain n=2 Tax=Neobacillus ginsengisoli TaxID=904295 RepID=A0ABT9XZN9_9BACI|nr:transcriptional regulator with XRE-family HTH domain [Neobacillus ginsengisoli]